MSVPRAKVTLTDPATDDYLSILIYTETQWGQNQRHEYEAALEGALDRLSLFPESGHDRGDVRPGLRCIRCKEHQLFFRFDADVVTILRILHVRQDPAQADFSE